MTTQNNPSSPFQNTNTPEKAGASDFSIRTMKDDLLMLQKNETLVTEKTTTAQNNLPEEPKATPIEKIEAPKPEPVMEKTFTPEVNPFSEKKFTADPVATKEPEVEKTSFSAPFKEQEKIAIVEVPVAEKKAASSSTAAYTVVLSFIVVLILAIIGLGGYYFWITTQTVEIETVPAVEVVTEQPAVQEEAPVVIAPAEKYSQSKPNYLSIDFATASSTDIQKAIASTLLELKEKGDKSLYEFILVDKNNNPVALPIFATAAKLTLSPTLLSSFERDFSLFVYNDAGIQHLALVTNAQKKDLVASEINKQEKTFVKDLSFLFLSTTPEIKTGQFKSGTYNGLSTRYLNLNKEETLSIDYALSDSQLIIGTSKNTLRAVIDRMTQTKNVSGTKSVEPTAVVTE